MWGKLFVPCPKLSFSLALTAGAERLVGDERQGSLIIGGGELDG